MKNRAVVIGSNRTDAIFYGNNIRNRLVDPTVSVGGQKIFYPDQNESNEKNQAERPLVRYCSQYILHETTSTDLENYTFLTPDSYNDEEHYYPAAGIMLRGSWADAETLTNMLDHNLPVIIVAESGGLATFIAEFLKDPREEREKIQAEVLRLLLQASSICSFSCLFHNNFKTTIIMA